MSDLEEQGHEQELTELGETQEMTDAVNALMSDDEAPELEASSDEPAEQHQDNDEEAPSTEGDEESKADYSTVEDSDLGAVFEYEGEKVTIGDLFENYKNREAPENLSAREEAISLRENELQTRSESQSYMDLEDKPHAFFQEVFEKMVGEGSLPASTAEAMIQAFRGSIQNGEYSVDGTEQRAQQAVKDREYNDWQENKSKQERDIEARSEVVELEGKYGKINKEQGQKILKLLQTASNENKPITMKDAFALAHKKGYFRQPPKNKASLASDWRNRGTQADAKTANETNLDDAVMAFYS